MVTLIGSFLLHFTGGFVNEFDRILVYKKRATLVKSSNTIKYHWVAAKVVGTPSILNTEKNIGATNIVVSNPLD